MSKTCPKCKVSLKSGKGLVPSQWIRGIAACWFSPKSDGKLIDVKKCPKCGHSEYEPN